MTDKETFKKSEELLQKYKYNWNKEVDLSCIPSEMTQEKFLVVLERIAETGESILVGWNKCFLTEQNPCINNPRE